MKTHYALDTKEMRSIIHLLQRGYKILRLNYSGAAKLFGRLNCRENRQTMLVGQGER